MKNYKFLIMISLAMFFCVGAQSNCKKAKMVKDANANADNKNMNDEMPLEEPNLDSQDSEIKKIAEGSYAKMDTPFVFVARTKETYVQLQAMMTEEKLLTDSEIDFNKTAVVAAFAGEKNTGGYSVSIDGSSGNVSIKVNSPPPDAMVTEALTMPYAVALVPVEEEESLNIDLSENWTKAAQTYKVMNGEFEYSGGLGGGQRKFEPQGTIKVLQSGDFITLVFDLEGKGDANQRKMNDIASGMLKSGKADLPRLEATNFIERPHPPLMVSGIISNDKMSLVFKPGKRSYRVNDGYEGSGSLEAVKGN